MVQQIYPKPCVRCGSCCRTEICRPGMQFLSTSSPPCPALEKQGAHYRCGLVENTAQYVYPGALSEEVYEKIRQYLIGQFQFGVGCDSKLHRDRPDQGMPPPPEHS